MQDETSRSRRVAGFTLVEALVALVVLSIGLLGVAGLQLTSLKSNHGSAARTQAVYLAYDIIDRMRANSASAIAGNYSAAPVAGTVAGDDLIAWQQNITNALPPGSIAPTGSVALDAATNLFTVTIKWDDAHAANVTGTAAPTDNIVTFSVSTQLSN
jgi:type IV pilus assembly protein PilV